MGGPLVRMAHRLPKPRQRLLWAIATATIACATQTAPDGRWVGDIRHEGGVERGEVTIEPGGRAATIRVPSWQPEGAEAATVWSWSDTMLLATAGGADSVRLRGVVSAGVWVGEATRGSETRSFVLRRLHLMNARDWLPIVGSYRVDNGDLLGIAPFSEFGTEPLIVQYATGRIGPLYPIAQDRFLVGHSLVAPVFPADTLDVTYGPGPAVRGIRFTERDHVPVEAHRLATRDEEIQFASGPITLHGTLTVPAGTPPYPALVLVHGSGPLTRDAFGPWARYFAGLGFAVLAYDKRGTGRSTGDWRQADFPTLAADVLAAVRVLADRRDTRPDRIGLWGISQGGWVLPLAASQAPREIAFLVVHAGSGTTVREQGVFYVQYELRFAGLPEASVAVGTRYQMLDDAVTRAGSGWDELQRYYEAHRSDEPWLWPPRPADDWFRPYYRRLMDFDPSPSWWRVTSPVLLFFGELDANVPPRESWLPIERALRRSGNPSVTHVVLPRANHLLLEARTGSRDEYPGLSRFVPGYFDRMAEWLRGQTR